MISLSLSHMHGSPQFKRIAAFTGDWQFQAPRRLTLSVVSQTQDAWAYRTFPQNISCLVLTKTHLPVFKRGKSTPYLGAYHSSDLSEFFTDIDYIGTDALSTFPSLLHFPHTHLVFFSQLCYKPGPQCSCWPPRQRQLSLRCPVASVDLEQRFTISSHIPGPGSRFQLHIGHIPRSTNGPPYCSFFADAVILCISI